MELIAGLGMAATAGTSTAKELFSYNRENFKFDQDQRIARETLRIEMQVKRFELFREDVRDLVELTVDRMDVYHLVGALFLEFCVILFCEGRIQASAPPFLLSLFLLSNACAFIYLLLAVWLSMHASIASHSFGVRLLTRFVRLPIPSIKQMNSLTSHLKDYERQGISNLLRLPFLSKNDWYQDDEEAKKLGIMPEVAKSKLDLPEAAKAAAGPGPPEMPGPATDGTLSSSMSPARFLMRGSSAKKAAAEKPGAPLLDTAANPQRTHSVPILVGDAPDRSTSAGAEDVKQKSGSAAPGSGRRESGASAAETLEASPPSGASSARRHDAGDASAAPPRPSTLLPDDMESPFGGDDLLAGQSGAPPNRHVQLFRQLQSKWQCYDAYCRVCMGLGVNQILQALSYYSICHTLVENRSPSTGYAMVVLFQCTSVALAVLDLAGLKRHEIIAIQVVGILPCFFTAWGVAHGDRNEAGVLDPEQTYGLSPLTFFSQVLWLELWLRVSAPSCDKSKLPRRFRQVLFLDVFGDAVGWDPSTMAEEDAAPEEELDRAMQNNPFDIDQNAAREAEEEIDAVAQDGAAQLQLATWAMQRWLAVPGWAFKSPQRHQLDGLHKSFKSWASTLRMELERRGVAHGLRPTRETTAEDGSESAGLRRWADLDADERANDPFAGCLVGPFEHDGGYASMTYYYDIETQRTIFEEAVQNTAPGALLLNMEAVRAMVDEMERATRRLLELRIVRDLKTAKRRQEEAAKEAAQAKLELQANLLPPALLERRRPLKVRALAVFPNIIKLFRKSAGTGYESLGGDEAGRRRRTRRRSGEQHEGSELLAGSGSPTSSIQPQAHTMGRASSDEASPKHRAPLFPPSPTRRDPTLVAMAGENAKHFVPERLPWQVLMRMTRVLQLCWFYSGLMTVLKEMGIYQVDFQQHPAHEGRRLGIVKSWDFEEAFIEWPQGSFFRPQGVVCPRDTADIAGSTSYDEWQVVISSPFATYTAAIAGSATPARLDEAFRSRASPGETLICNRTEAPLGPSVAPAPKSDCIFVAPDQGGLAFWPAGAARSGPSAAVLPLDSAPWKLIAGGIVPCRSVGSLLPPQDKGESLSCLVLAGWDGTMLPVAVLPLPLSGLLPSRGHLVQPSVDVPLYPIGERLEIVALHFAPESGRLWAIKAGNEVQAWDLLKSRSLGRLKLQWPYGDGVGGAAAGFQPAAVCEDTWRGVLVAVGRSGIGGPTLLRARLPLEIIDRLTLPTA